MKKLVTLILIVFIVLNSFSQTISTNRDIYNFEVGDIFHYEHQMSSPNSGASITLNVEITKKYYSQGQDSVFYIRNLISKTVGSGIPSQTSLYSDTIFFTSLDSLVNSGFIDSVYFDTSIYNGRKINRDTNSFYDLYVDSLGKVVDVIYSDPTTLTFNENRLIYYRKGNEEWGNPIYLGLNDNNELKFYVKVYPNPTSNKLNIVLDEVPKEPVMIELFDITGRLIENYYINNERNMVIDIGNLKSGVYILNTKSYEGWTKSSKIIKN